MLELTIVGSGVKKIRSDSVDERGVTMLVERNSLYPCKPITKGIVVMKNSNEDIIVNLVIFLSTKSTANKTHIGQHSSSPDTAS